MKKIILTGACGQLGRAVSKMYVGRENIELIETDVHNLDITNLASVLQLVENEKPYAIINCAAYTAVDNAEDEPDKAYLINVIGSRNLAIAAKKVNAKIVQISTDYIFDGNIDRHYTEFDTPNPLGVYAKTKFEGENCVKAFNDKYFIIRIAWLYGEGNNFVKTMLRLAETRDEVSVVADQFGTPTSTKVVGEIIDTLIWTDNYGVFNGTCEGECSWAEFAEEIFKLADKNVLVKRITTGEYPAKAKRPAYAVLDNYMLKLTTDYVAPDWKESLKQYMEENICSKN